MLTNSKSYSNNTNFYHLKSHIGNFRNTTAMLQPLFMFCIWYVSAHNMFHPPTWQHHATIDTNMTQHCINNYVHDSIRKMIQDWLKEVMEIFTSFYIIAYIPLLYNQCTYRCLNVPVTNETEPELPTSSRLICQRCKPSTDMSMWLNPAYDQLPQPHQLQRMLTSHRHSGHML